MVRQALLTTVACVLVWATTTLALEIASKPRQTLERPEGEVFSVAFSADGKYVCAGGERGVVYCWDANSGEVANRITAHLRAAVFSVVAYPLAPFAVHASELGIKFHLIGGHGRVPSFPFKHMQTVLALDFSSDGNHMASGDRGGETIVWDLWTGEPYRRFQPAKAPVNSLRYHPDGTRLAVATNDGNVRLYDTKADKLLYEVAAHEGECNSVAFTGDGRWFASAGKDRKIRIWNTEGGRAVATLEGHEDAVNTVVVQPKGARLLLSASDDRTVRLWNLDTRKSVQTIPHQNAVYGLAWSSDGRMVATGAGKVVQLFEVK